MLSFVKHLQWSWHDYDYYLFILTAVNALLSEAGFLVGVSTIWTSTLACGVQFLFDPKWYARHTMRSFSGVMGDAFWFALPIVLCSEAYRLGVDAVSYLLLRACAPVIVSMVRNSLLLPIARTFVDKAQHRPLSARIRTRDDRRDDRRSNWNKLARPVLCSSASICLCAIASSQVSAVPANRNGVYAPWVGVLLMLLAAYANAHFYDNVKVHHANGHDKYCGHAQICALPLLLTTSCFRSPDGLEALFSEHRWMFMLACSLLQCLILNASYTTRQTFGANGSTLRRSLCATLVIVTFYRSNLTWTHALATVLALVAMV